MKVGKAAGAGSCRNLGGGGGAVVQGWASGETWTDWEEGKAMVRFVAGRLGCWGQDGRLMPRKGMDQRETPEGR